MDLYIFNQKYDSTLERIPIQVENFKNGYLDAKFGRSLHRMVLQDDKNTLFDLLLADILLVYTKQSDPSRVFPLEQIADFSYYDLGIGVKHQELLEITKRKEEEKIRKINNITSSLAEHFSEKKIKYFKILSQITEEMINNPRFLREFKEKFTFFKS